ncbi:hypothetical protein HMPREF9120_00080 [Neisseria sp. oral taxon 020 str. F0370]|nr:hypothetical protein HMPREF9120_00080 [Neisseria sp. oral taxon 020 str. F0370]
MEQAHFRVPFSLWFFRRPIVRQRGCGWQTACKSGKTVAGGKRFGYKVKQR